MDSASEYIRSRVRTVPDWPRPGVQFRDITPLLNDRKTFRVLMDTFVQRYVDWPLDAVAGIDARGFILGAVIARELNLAFIPVRKKGKLPFDTLAEDYSLEYGQASIEVHRDACPPDAAVLLVDDLIATGGSMMAAARLLRRLEARILECTVIIDLPELGGSELLARAGLSVHSLCSFGGH